MTRLSSSNAAIAFLAERPSWLSGTHNEPSTAIFGPRQRGAPTAHACAGGASGAVRSSMRKVTPLARAQHDARRGAVGSNHAQRETVHLVPAGLDVAKVQSFDDNRAAAEQDVMGRRAGPLEFLNRQIVDPDHLDAVIDKVPRA